MSNILKFSFEVSILVKLEEIASMITDPPKTSFTTKNTSDQCVTNIRIRIRIREYQSEYSYSYSYSPFFVTPNIFVFVFALFYQHEYICIRICLRHGYRICKYLYNSTQIQPNTINCILWHIYASFF